MHADFSKLNFENLLVHRIPVLIWATALPCSPCLVPLPQFDTADFARGSCTSANPDTVCCYVARGVWIPTVN